MLQHSRFTGKDMLNLLVFWCYYLYITQQELIRLRNLPSKSIKSSSGQIVLSTTPEPSSEHPDSFAETNDFDIPETQFTQKPSANDDDDFFVHVQTNDFNSWLPETETQQLDSRSNSPSICPALDSQCNALPTAEDDDETDCEEEMSVLNWNEKSILTEVRPICGSTTPDLVFDAFTKEAEQTSTSHVVPRGDLDDEIPASQAPPFVGVSELSRIGTPNPNQNDISNDIFDCETPPDSRLAVDQPLLRRSKRVSREDVNFTEAATQVFIPPKKAREESVRSRSIREKRKDCDINLAEAETQVFVHPSMSDKNKDINFAEAQTQLFVHPSMSSKEKDIHFAEAPTQLFVHRSTSPQDKATNFAEAPTQVFVHPIASTNDKTINFAEALTQVFVLPAANAAAGNKMDDVFDQPTQLLDEDDPFNQATQLIAENDPFNQATQLMAEDDPFNQDTQLMADDDPFDQPTQRMVHSSSARQAPSKQSQDDQTLGNFSRMVTNETDDVYDVATQEFTVLHPQTSVAYSTTDFTPNTSVTSTCSPSNKENHDKINQSKVTAEHPTGISNVDFKVKPPKGAKARLRSLSSEVFECNTPDYNFLKLADPDKIRSLDAEAMNREQPLRPFLFHDSSDEDNLELELQPVPKRGGRSKFVPKVASSKAATKLQNVPPAVVVATSKDKHPSKSNPIEECVIRKSSRRGKPVSKRKSNIDEAMQNAAPSKKQQIQPKGDMTSTESSATIQVPKRNLRAKEPVTQTAPSSMNNIPMKKSVVKLKRLSSTTVSSEPESEARKLRVVEKPQILFTIVSPKPHSDIIERIGKFK